MTDALLKLAQQQGGYVLIFLFALITGARGEWFFKHAMNATIAEKKAQYDQMVAQKDALIAERVATVAYRDQQIAEREREIARERERADMKEQYALRLLEAAKQAAEIAAAALAARKEGPP